MDWFEESSGRREWVRSAECVFGCEGSLLVKYGVVRRSGGSSSLEMLLDGRE